MICVPCAGYFLVVVKIAPYYADRYLMPIFPLIALITGILLQKSLDVLKRYLRAFGHRGVLTSLTVLIVLPGLLMRTPEYLYKGYDVQEQIAEKYGDRACVCVYEGVGYYQNLVEFTHYRETLLVTQEELLGRPEDEVLRGEQEVVVMMKNNIDQGAVKKYLEERYGFYPAEYLIRASVHYDTVQLFRKK